MNIIQKIVISSFIGIISITNIAMNTQGSKRIVEIVELDNAQHQHQVKCFIDSYIAGKVTIDNGSVYFDDYDTKETTYEVRHAHTLRLLESLRVRSDEIQKQMRENFSKFRKNKSKEFTAQEINILQEYRLIAFEFDKDLFGEEIYHGKSYSELESVREDRYRYKKAFKDGSRIELAIFSKINPGEFFCSLAVQIQRLYVQAEKLNDQSNPK